MSLPPGFLDELRARLTLSDVVGRSVTWDRRKSNAARGDFWAPCPFHQEKTPSFHVDDRKGFYYCFGCQAKGDLIGFTMQAGNLSFIEAVERLAAEAGLEMPREHDAPQAQAARDRSARLVEVMEQAAALYGLAFRSAAGARAREYAAGRGLSAGLLARFGIGYAPDSRSHATEAFRSRGLLEEAVEAGLLIRPEDGGAPYDRFRDRLMFPIRDARGRCIAFGGRALGEGAGAKYLNSPETPLFHKGRTLFHIGPARAAAGRSGRLVLAEGYMDVIAFVAAEVEEAVAPLGTAITEEQLRLAWRMAPEPLVALDGDAAGLRAAGRLIDLALPLLTPGRSLGFCLLPTGKDPDDILRDGGPGALRAVLDSPLPLIEMLWRRERDAGPHDTPERRADLHRRLREAAARIADPVIRGHYEDDLRARERALFRRAPPGGQAGSQSGGAFGPQGRAQGGTWQGGGRRGGFGTVKAGPMMQTRGTALARSLGPETARRGREATILLISLHNPGVLGPVLSALETMPCTIAEYERLRDMLVEAVAEGAAETAMGADGSSPGLAALLAGRLGLDPLALLEAEPVARGHLLARPGADRARVLAVLGDAIAWHEAQCARESEMAEARRDFSDAPGEDWTARIAEAVQAPQTLALRAFSAEDAVEAACVSPIALRLEALERRSGARPVADTTPSQPASDPATNAKKPEEPSSNQ